MKVILTSLSIFISATLLLQTNAMAQQDEIVVTGSRVSIYESEEIPFINLRAKPDFMIQEVYIESDSREEGARTKEVDATLKSLAARARSNKLIELNLQKTIETDDDEIEYLVPFDLAGIEYGRGSRPDTTRIYIIIKTPIDDKETSPEVIEKRLDDFIGSVATTGRAIVKPYGAVGLSIVDLQQYRLPLLQKLAEDNQSLKAIFGNENKILIEGLERQVRWRVTGPLQLTLYFPYKSAVGGGR